MPEMFGRNPYDKVKGSLSGCLSVLVWFFFTIQLLISPVRFITNLGEGTQEKSP